MQWRLGQGDAYGGSFPLAGTRKTPNIWQTLWIYIRCIAMLCCRIAGVSVALAAPADTRDHGLNVSWPTIAPSHVVYMTSFVSDMIYDLPWRDVTWRVVLARWLLRVNPPLEVHAYNDLGKFDEGHCPFVCNLGHAIVLLSVYFPPVRVVGK